MHNLTFGSKYTKSYKRTHFIERHAAGNMFITMMDSIFEIGEQLFLTLLFYTQSISKYQLKQYSGFVQVIFKAAPVAEWLRPLIVSALNRSSSHHCKFESVLYAGGHVFCLGDLPCLSHLMIDSAQNV